jgi:hypothetical protein
MPKSTVQPESLNTIVRGFKSNPISQAKEQTIWQLSAEDEKSISALEMNILWDMADSILGSYSIYRIDFSPYNPSKIPALEKKE